MCFLYLIRLSDGSLYCGVTNDLARRLEEHSLGRGSKYVKGRRPLKLVYSEEHDSREEALRREVEIKKWNKGRKEDLVRSQGG